MKCMRKISFIAFLIISCVDQNRKAQEAKNERLFLEIEVDGLLMDKKPIQADSVLQILRGLGDTSIEYKRAKEVFYYHKHKIL